MTVERDVKGICESACTVTQLPSYGYFCIFVHSPHLMFYTFIHIYLWKHFYLPLNMIHWPRFLCDIMRMSETSSESETVLCFVLHLTERQRTVLCFTVEERNFSFGFYYIFSNRWTDFSDKCLSLGGYLLGFPLRILGRYSSREGLHVCFVFFNHICNKWNEYEVFMVFS